MTTTALHALAPANRSMPSLATLAGAPARRTLLLACAGWTLAACASSSRGASAPNATAAADRAGGWVPLFDGRTFAGWRGVGYDTVPSAHWRIVDGTIEKIATKNVVRRADGLPVNGGDLMTKDTYGDFELAWDWKVTPGANSGVKYNVSEELSTSVPTGGAGISHSALGFEYQMIDDDRHPDGKLVRHKTSDLYDLLSANERKHARPVGEWNSSRIVFRGNHGEHWLNGELVVAYDLGTARMDSALAASKYRTIPHFGDRRRGHIVLQDHGDEVYFRNIRIRTLDGDARSATR